MGCSACETHRCLAAPEGMGYARSGEEMRRVEKVVVYCVRDGRLLVFRHIDYPPEVVGLQVPAGSILEGESKEVAALRELQEETGRKGFVITAYLGRSFYDISPYREEIQERFFFRASATALIDEKWIGGENNRDGAPPVRFEFFWIPLPHGHVLQSGQGALLGRLTNPPVRPISIAKVC